MRFVDYLKNQYPLSQEIQYLLLKILLFRKNDSE